MAMCEKHDQNVILKHQRVKPGKSKKRDKEEPAEKERHSRENLSS